MGSVTKKSDIFSKPLLCFAFYCLPVAAILASACEYLSRGWRTAIWTLALGVMGTTCIANAARCGRTHCYITGPFFLLMALGAFLYGAGVIDLGAHGWNLIGMTTLIGAIILTCLPELFFEKYRGN